MGNSNSVVTKHEKEDLKLTHDNHLDLVATKRQADQMKNSSDYEVKLYILYFLKLI